MFLLCYLVHLSVAEEDVLAVKASSELTTKSVLVEACVGITSSPFWQQKLEAYIVDLPAHMACEERLASAFEQVQDMKEPILTEASIAGFMCIVNNLSEWQMQLRSITIKGLQADMVKNCRKMCDACTSDEADREQVPLTTLEAFTKLLEEACKVLPSEVALAKGLENMKVILSGEAQAEISRQIMEWCADFTAKEGDMDCLIGKIKSFLSLCESENESLQGCIGHERMVSSLQSAAEKVINVLITALGDSSIPDSLQCVLQWLDRCAELLAASKYEQLSKCYGAAIDLVQKTEVADSKESLTALHQVRQSLLKLQKLMADVKTVLSEEECEKWTSCCVTHLSGCQARINAIGEKNAGAAKKDLETKSANLAKLCKPGKEWQSAMQLKTFQPCLNAAKKTILTIDPKSSDELSKSLSQVGT
eukprot:6492768-Amphidinium_carterae.2